MPVIRYLHNIKRKMGLSHNALTIIAMVTMFLDHAALTLIQNGKLYGYDAVLYSNAITLPEANTWVILYKVLRMIGRISFPIFAFLIVEGFRKTSNLFKYALRLIVLAFISEIPYDLMVFNEIFTLRCFEVQNVVFTYVIGLAMLIVIRALNSLPSILTIFPVAAACAITYFLKTDYAIEGIVLMYIFYILRHDLDLKCLIAAIITFTMSFQNYYGAAVLSILFIFLYDGTKGSINLGRFHYIFYPLHMLLLYGILFFSNLGN